ncbi:MAG: hypothetical protein D6743_18795 [Calditrichaeota bacterium]|nr:MAG: hypothetical protein D6743_18795 [Calditrichota bacterium]
MLLRLILWGLLLYLAIKVFSGWLKDGGKPKSEIKGESKGNTPLDLSKLDVEDADFEDLPD